MNDINAPKISRPKPKVSGLAFGNERAARAALDFRLETLDVKRQKLAISVLWALSFVPAIAAAQVMNDPTRPPPSVLSATPGNEGHVGGPQLQSVMISPTERSAIIGGERVIQGGRYGDARVIRITESEVVLRSAGGIETLRMYPDIEIKLVKPAPVVAAPKTARKPAVKSKKTRGKQQ